MILFKSDEKVVVEGVADGSLATTTANKESSSGGGGGQAANGDTQSKVDDLYTEDKSPISFTLMLTFHLF